MISVSVSICAEPIMCRSARRIKDADEKGYSTYKVDSGEIIKHKCEEGAKVLAKKMLDLIEDV